MDAIEDTPPTEIQSPFWSRHLRREVQYLLDLSLLAAAFALAYLLRFDFQIPLKTASAALVQLPVVVLIQFVAMLGIGVYQFVWRYVGLGELRTFLHAAVYSSLPLLTMRFMLPDGFQQWRIPLSVILMDTVFAFAGILGIRVLRRVLYERYERRRRQSAVGNGRRQTVLLAGAGRAGVASAHEIHGRGDLNLTPAGFVDDDPLKTGTVIQGLEVLGTIDDIPRLAAELHVDRVVITIAEPGSEALRRIFKLCERAGVRMQIIPGLYEILLEKVSISRFRDVQIEDLLGREPVRLDEGEIRRFLTDKRVMVTGAGGSIGSELARQLPRYNPDRVLLVERAEGALFEIDSELREIWPLLDVVPLVADVGDPHRVREILEEHRPHVVLHAAAHKHVPMMEDHPTEAVRNNVLATKSLGRAAGDHGVQSFVLISTDKAVQPSSVMGATKRLAELVIQDLDRDFGSTRFLAVRFGNVLGSTGSVVPIFRRQIRAGGPVTVTHPEATRYFMTLSEAAQLVLEAGAIGAGGEILTLDMGEPVKILDLARDMIKLSGHEPFEEIPIVFTGLRPGEKLFEQLEFSSESLDRTRHPKIFVGRLEAAPPERLEQALSELAGMVRRGAGEEIRQTLEQVVPEARLGRPVEMLPQAEAGSAREAVH